MVIKKLQSLIGSHAVLHACPTLREPDGLALSSRNLRLNAAEREAAAAISQALLSIKKELRPGPLQPLVATAKSLLEQHRFKIDYVTIADAATLDEVNGWDGEQSLVALVAAYINEVRLIDNMLLGNNS